MIETKVRNIKDNTQYGYDIIEDNQLVKYYIQADVTGSGKNPAIWLHNRTLTSYNSFKEALKYLQIARKKKMFPNTTYKVVRTLDNKPTNLELIETEDEGEYYN